MMRTYICLALTVSALCLGGYQSQAFAQGQAGRLADDFQQAAENMRRRQQADDMAVAARRAQEQAAEQAAKQQREAQQATINKQYSWNAAAASNTNSGQVSAAPLNIDPNASYSARQDALAVQRKAELDAAAENSRRQREEANRRLADDQRINQRKFDQQKIDQQRFDNERLAQERRRADDAAAQKRANDQRMADDKRRQDQQRFDERKRNEEVVAQKKRQQDQITEQERLAQIEANKKKLQQDQIIQRQQNEMRQASSADPKFISETPPKAPDYVVTSNGNSIIVPDNAVGPLPTRSSGIQYLDGAGGKGLDDKVTGVRIMDKTDQHPPRVVYMNQSGQSVNPTTGNTVAKKDPSAHINLNDGK